MKIIFTPNYFLDVGNTNSLILLDIITWGHNLAMLFVSMLILNVHIDSCYPLNNWNGDYLMEVGLESLSFLSPIYSIILVKLKG
jgi:hypothetical protein